jgi:cobalt-zinc-cadmium efflux system outer membrane protein
MAFKTLPGFGALVVALLLAVVPQEAGAQAPVTADPLSEVLTRDAAIRWALHHNPDLLAYRQQRGIASAALLIAQTYPFNPTWTNKLFGVTGPESAGVTNHLAMEQRVDLQLELRGQRGYRVQAASAGLSKAEWQIVQQEALLAVRVVRAFDAVLYQRNKVKLANESLHLQERTAAQVPKLIEARKLRAPDAILAQTEADTARITLETARAARQKAEYDLRAALGLTDETIKIEGELKVPEPPVDAMPLIDGALSRRPDVQGRQAAVTEAEAKVNLARADRFGNPTIGPDFEYNETRAVFVGVQIAMPLPVLNKRRGEIMQRETERALAIDELHSIQVAVRQQIHAALGRQKAARTIVERYKTVLIPNLEKSLEQMEDLLEKGEVTLLNVIDTQRKLLTARNGYADALYELRQAQDDLAAAAADLTLAVGEPAKP